jgi:hypothetical protein
MGLNLDGLNAHNSATSVRSLFVRCASGSVKGSPKLVVQVYI